MALKKYDILKDIILQKKSNQNIHKTKKSNKCLNQKPADSYKHVYRESGSIRSVHDDDSGKHQCLNHIFWLAYLSLF